MAVGFFVLLSAALILLMRETEPPISAASTTRSLDVQPTFADQLEAASSNLGDLELMLTAETRAGNLSYGNQQDFFSPADCFIVVFDDANAAAVAVLEPGDGSRQNQLTGLTIDDVDTFLLNRIAIWVLPAP